MWTLAFSSSIEARRWVLVVEMKETGITCEPASQTGPGNARELYCSQFTSQAPWAYPAQPEAGRARSLHKSCQRCSNHQVEAQHYCLAITSSAVEKPLIPFLITRSGSFLSSDCTQSQLHFLPIILFTWHDQLPDLKCPMTLSARKKPPSEGASLCPSVLWNTAHIPLEGYDWVLCNWKYL